MKTNNTFIISTPIQVERKNEQFVFWRSLVVSGS